MSAASDGNGPPINRGSKGITMSARSVVWRPPAAEASAVKIKRVMSVTRYTQNKTGTKDVGNSTSSAPAMSKPRSCDRGSEISLFGFRLFAVGITLGRAGKDLFGD